LEGSFYLLNISISVWALRAGGVATLTSEKKFSIFFEILRENR